LATLTTQNITRAGVAQTYGAAAGGGDGMECGANMFLQVKNGSGAPITVTLNVPAARVYEPNVAITSPTVSIPATTGDKMIGPIDAATFADPTTGLCSITYSGVSSLTVAAIKLTQP